MHLGSAAGHVAHAEHEHRIHLRAFQYALDRARHHGAIVSGHQVDGIAPAPPARQDRIEFFQHTLRQRDQIESGLGAGIGADDAPATALRHDDHTASARKRLVDECRGQFHGLIEIFRDICAGLPARADEQRGGPRERARV
ncbi:MAG: hypothetical protein BWY09_01256 [Candidatus Hydrogenedentes bacterium ADurb.Bin179]|nr:MAG: hypothetical protein BWY09_01256 [Candidatus Hydrogenedentes bacterium ADurb.Bin179]